VENFYFDEVLSRGEGGGKFISLGRGEASLVHRRADMDVKG
jgi:hypothetical protein